MSWVVATLCALTLLGCDAHPTHPGDVRGSTSEDPSKRAESSLPPGGVAIPGSVRTNLGLTFARVERRAVVDTLRVPGRFELQPNARREHRSALAGRVTLLAHQYQAVDVGAPLYELNAPGWRDLQRELAETQSAIQLAGARVAALPALIEAHELHEQGLRDMVDLWSRRVEQLQELQASGAGRAADLAEAQAQLTGARSSFGEVLEKDAEINLRHLELSSELQSAQARLTLQLTAAAALTGLEEADLVAPVGASPEAPPRWQVLRSITVRAALHGVVERNAVTDGAWVEEGELVTTVVDPTALRFRAVALQSDLGVLATGLPATVVSAQGHGIGLSAPIPATLQIGLDADPQHRTIELLASFAASAPWARPGVAAYLEVTASASAATELAVPLAAVQQDGLERVLFRRHPSQPDLAIRMRADLGEDDGRWVVVHSGLAEGDEVVLDGAALLLLATADKPAQGVHVHADGTVHTGDH